MRCFYCNGSLRNWQAKDDPRVEHARWFPKCDYIRQFIGENLYQAVQRKSRQLEGRRTERSHREHEKPHTFAVVWVLLAQRVGTHGSSSTISQWTDEEIRRMVRARRDLPVVQTLLNVGYTIDIIQ